MEPAQPLDVLKQYWGYDTFRPLQEDIINAALNDKDVLALLPTGGGKSICFQVPALLLNGVCVVVSPLIALMKDQVENLKARGIAAAAIYSGMNKRELDLTLDNCIYGHIKFLYLSPERLRTELLLERVAKMSVALLVVDEAHCISQWGYDFRPSYLQIAEFKSRLPQVSTMALTATATNKVQIDIQEKLGFSDAYLFRKSFARANLSYSVRKVEDKKQKLLEVLESIAGSGIVYVSTRRATKEVASWLKKRKIDAEYYHGGLEHEDRMAKQEQWILGKTRIIVCTNAFGMGIDKPDVRVVAHLDIPPNLESYYQEAGRAGRDERNAYAVIIYEEKDLEELTTKTNNANPRPKLVQDVYQALANHYQLAIGSNNFRSYDFEIREFSNKYDIDPSQLFHALKILERAGIIELSEGFHHPSRATLSLQNEDLYHFQVSNPRFDHVTKGLLRLYGGELYSNYVVISESRLAAYLEIEIQEVIKDLYALSKQDVLVYIPQKEKPQISFVQPRLDAKKLHLDESWLKEKRKQDMGRAQAMIDYVKHQHRCRTQILLEYFDEVSYEKCGVCDICLTAKQNANPQHQDKCRVQILAHLQANDMVTLQDLTEVVEGSKDQLINTLRAMQDAGEILQEDNSIRLLY